MLHGGLANDHLFGDGKAAGLSTLNELILRRLHVAVKILVQIAPLLKNRHELSLTWALACWFR